MRSEPNDIPEDTRQPKDLELIPARGSARFPFWFVVAGCWIVWGGLYTIHLRTVKDGASLTDVVRYAYSDAVLWGLATPLVWWLARRLPVRRPFVGRRLALHVLLAALVSTGILLLDILQGRLISGDFTGWSVEDSMQYALQYRLNSNLLVYAALVAIGHVLDHHRRLQASELELGALRADLAEARLRVIRSQLRPHFLFNCLNTISGLVEVRPEEARRMIGHLSELLRLTLEGPFDETIPLADELRIVDSYLALEKARFGERLRVDVDVPATCTDVRVPPVLLQPLVENAVRHGLAHRPEGGSVALRARREDGRLELSVEDDGIGVENIGEGSGDSPGIGLTSVRERLRGLYGAHHDFAVQLREGGGTCVRILLPIS